MQYDFDNELLEKLGENIAKVRADIRSCCIAAGRDPEEITLIGVSKVFPVEYAEAAVGSKIEYTDCISIGDRYDIDLSLAIELGMGGILVNGAEDVCGLVEIL